MQTQVTHSYGYDLELYDTTSKIKLTVRRQDKKRKKHVSWGCKEQFVLQATEDIKTTSDVVLKLTDQVTLAAEGSADTTDLPTQVTPTTGLMEREKMDG